MSKYIEIWALKRQLKRNVPDLLALSQQNDPFYVGGTKTTRAQAEWFAALWEEFEFTDGVHLRRIHYRLVNRAEPPTRHNGKPFKTRSLILTSICRVSPRA
jgi:hypothetical protein